MLEKERILMDKNHDTLSFKEALAWQLHQTEMQEKQRHSERKCREYKDQKLHFQEISLQNMKNNLRIKKSRFFAKMSVANPKEALILFHQEKGVLMQQAMAVCEVEYF